jgi:hypothetical protein
MPTWAQDDRVGAERDRVPHVTEHGERLGAQPHRLGEPRGRRGERGRAVQRVPAPDRAGHPVQADIEIGQFALDGAELPGLEEGVDPPQPAPHLGPGAAHSAGRFQHPLRQPGSLGHAFGGGAGQLAGAEGVQQGLRVAGRLGGFQGVAADLAGPLVLAAVHQRLGVAGGHPGA